MFADAEKILPEDPRMRFIYNTIDWRVVRLHNALKQIGGPQLAGNFLSWRKVQWQAIAKEKGRSGRVALTTL